MKSEHHSQRLADHRVSVGRPPKGCIGLPVACLARVNVTHVILSSRPSRYSHELMKNSELPAAIPTSQYTGSVMGWFEMLLGVMSSTCRF